CSAFDRDKKQGAVRAGDEREADAEQHLRQRHAGESRSQRVGEPASEPKGSADHERPAVAEPVGDVAGRKLADNRRRAEDRLKPDDLGQRHADLVFPEKRDDGNRKKREAQPRGGGEQRRVAVRCGFHGNRRCYASMRPRTTDIDRSGAIYYEASEGENMQVKAAVAYEAAKPLAIETVELEGPKDGEVLVEIKATGVCHTDEFTRSGADPEGLFPVIFGH